MKILGISSGHDSGAAIIENGRVIAAINEERLNRKKLYWGVPFRSILACLELTHLTPQDIDYIAIANLTDGGGIQREFREGKLTYKKKIFDLLSFTGLTNKKISKKIYLFLLSRRRKETEILSFLKKEGFKTDYKYIEHHLSHAASAYYTSQFSKKDKVLVATCDGSGDGLCATISVIDKNGFLNRRNETVTFHSPASSFYSNITFNLGFKPLNHEGKITGLAAYGQPDITVGIFKKYLKTDLKKLEFRSKLGCYGRPAAKKLHLLCQGFKREDIAAGLQKGIEEVGSRLIQEAASRYNCDKICLAGGLFANVRLNQVIMELPNIKDIYIHPHMGDGGIAVGAALALWSENAKSKNETIDPVKLSHVYLGQSFDDRKIQTVLKKSELLYKHFNNIELEIAKLLAKGKVVARFNGAMEYGPRALGNRSILYKPTDSTVNDWLNKKLKRTEFMPFAPIILFDQAGNYFKNFNPRYSFATEFMTITYNATDKCKKEAPAVVHIDGTARPQTVKQDINPSIYKIIFEYKKITGLPIVINTSFNIHEEPIVCTPEDAIRAFKIGHLDILAIGNYIVFNK